jgi:teichuronic acid biosynthesis glycosyltransferase TuaC
VRQVGDESTLGRVRALVVTNMWPSAAAPHRGVFVRDQVDALRRRPGVEVEVFAFPPGPRALLRAIATIRRHTRAAPPQGPHGARRAVSDGEPRHGADGAPGSDGEPHGEPRRGAPFDVVHAHFGLAALPALAARRGPVVVTLHGNDLFVRRSRLVTRAALPFTALPAAVSRAFSRNLPGAGTRRRVAVLPVGIALERFRPIPRAEARARLGLDPDGPYLLFPHDPARPLKRFDRAREAAGDVPLLTLGAVPPDEVPYWINAANAVLVPSQDEGFGLSVIEALACGVPAFGTPVGIHPVALHGIDGAFCEEWDPERWRAALRPVLEQADPRVDGRARAELFSADRMAARVVEAWREIAAQDGAAGRGARGPAYTRRFESIGDRAPDRP